jgi:hypothetical protein
MPGKERPQNQDITLQISIQKGDGTPYAGTVDIEIQHQALSDRREFRAVGASKTITIGGLHRTPQGLYKVTVTPTTAFEPQSQFVTIPASGFATVQFSFGGGSDLELPHLKERAQFRALIVGNPNYFGNLQDSVFQPVLPINSNTTYEELMCVGFNPQLSKLEAVVHVKQQTGYNGGICSSGSTEYVRFWLSFDDGMTWVDQGMETFTAYDLPAQPHPLEYAVALRIDPARLFCTTPNLLLVRAILSWNDPPTDPNTPPVWGNVRDARIQIEPWFLLVYFPELLKVGINIPEPILSLIDDTQPLKLKKPPKLSPVQLKQAYAGKVPDHRFLHAELQKFIAFPELAVASKLPGAKGVLADVGVDISAAIAALLATDGNTNFEELTCIGLDPNPATQDALVGVIRVKQPSGYLGGLCDEGSTEYVAFWIDFGDGIWQWMGTGQVQVHDIANVPQDGLLYAVYQPVNLEAHRRPCTDGPVTARMRAILSWNTPPNPANPNWVPTWGNREETNIHIYPGVPVPTGDYTPRLHNLCGIAVCNIDQATGFAPGDRPWGASVFIHGAIPGAPDVNTPVANRPRYQITVRQLPGGAPQHLNDTFYYSSIDETTGAVTTSYTSPADTAQSADGLDFYTYREAPPVPGVGWREVNPSRLLAVWNTGGKTGLWEISIIAKDPVTNTVFLAATTQCILDGTSRQSVNIYLDQAPPVTSLAITGYQRNGVGPVLTDILNCGTFQVGDVIHGSYSVSDEHFNALSLSGQPIPGGGAARFSVDGIATNSLSYPAVPGQPGDWTFNTAELEPCGYTIQLSTSDRTIVGCGTGWQNNSAFVGFCLVAPPA